MEPLLAFRSVSTDKQYQKEIDHLVKWLSQKFEDHDFKVQSIEGYGNPLLVAEYQVSAQLPTVLIYGHYDVQPAEIEEGWESDPFRLAVRQNRVFGRGIVDNKGQVGVHIATVFKLIDQNKLRYNVKFLLEGDEETGSGNMEGFVSNYQDLLAADFVLISDGEVVAGLPVMERGFRGSFNSTLTVRTAKMDVHSGMFGGALPNAALELSKVLVRLGDNIPSADVQRYPLAIGCAKPDLKTIQEHQRLPFSQAELTKNTGAKAYFVSGNLDFYSQVTLLPALEISGIQTGYNGEGYRNSIPATATAKINMRTAPSQDPGQVQDVLKDLIGSFMPDYVHWDLEFDSSASGVEIDVDNKYAQRAREILTEVYGQQPYLKNVGGTLPIITLFARMLDVPQVVVPLANEDCGMHSPNENFELKHLEKALVFSEKFLGK